MSSLWGPCKCVGACKSRELREIVFDSGRRSRPMFYIGYVFTFFIAIITNSVIIGIGLFVIVMISSYMSASWRVCDFIIMHQSELTQCPNLKPDDRPILDAALSRLKE